MRPADTADALVAARGSNSRAYTHLNALISIRHYLLQIRLGVPTDLAAHGTGPRVEETGTQVRTGGWSTKIGLASGMKSFAAYSREMGHTLTFSGRNKAKV